MLKNTISIAGGFELADLFPSNKLLRMRRKLDTILDDIIKEHKLKHSGMEEIEIPEKIRKIGTKPSKAAGYWPPPPHGRRASTPSTRESDPKVRSHLAFADGRCFDSGGFITGGS
ncbi:hypothetical protein BUALT_Bualt10G0103500 [Buddleja alternifolia]|uniref:Uncharacterized protein n=1 Tax=Buddleja alternifolia TaxID=168488 RepID=A0AAV6X8G0_9LAMI|nr:hypothetical protein BUALT_Bualt10G0103500 [Buddleja alternifolia]